MSTHKIVELPKRTMASRNPFTGEVMREFEQHSDDVLEQKIERAIGTFHSYRETSFAERSRRMLRAAEILEAAIGADSSDVTEARVRLSLDRGDPSGARDLVDRWSAEPQSRGDRQRRLWLAVLDHLDGRDAPACEAMQAVVTDAEREGDIGLFVMAGTYALGPARALYRSAPTSFLRAVVERPVAARRVKTVRGLAEQLTDREYMVLVHLPSRQSNAEIAERLAVSLNTVKTHLKHIYRKLEVDGRSEAVEAAERLHLL